MSNKTIFYWHSKLTFGKYKGQTVTEVFEVDPKYLLWADSDNGPEWFQLADEVYEAVIEEVDSGNDDFTF